LTFETVLKCDIFTAPVRTPSGKGSPSRSGKERSEQKEQDLPIDNLAAAQTVVHCAKALITHI